MATSARQLDRMKAIVAPMRLQPRGERHPIVGQFREMPRRRFPARLDVDAIRNPIRLSSIDTATISPFAVIAGRPECRMAATMSGRMVRKDQGRMLGGAAANIAAPDPMRPLEGFDDFVCDLQGERMQSSSLIA